MQDGARFRFRVKRFFVLAPDTSALQSPPVCRNHCSQEAILFERAEADSLNHLERKVFLKTRILDYGEEDNLTPVSVYAKYLAWLTVVAYAVGMSFYVCLFAVKAGRATSVQWMISFWVAFAEVSCISHLYAQGQGAFSCTSMTCLCTLHMRNKLGHCIRAMLLVRYKTGGCVVEFAAKRATFSEFTGSAVGKQRSFCAVTYGVDSRHRDVNAGMRTTC